MHGEKWNKQLNQQISNTKQSLNNSKSFSTNQAVGIWQRRSREIVAEDGRCRSSGGRFCRCWGAAVRITSRGIDAGIESTGALLKLLLLLTNQTGEEETMSHWPLPLLNTMADIFQAVDYNSILKTKQTIVQWTRQRQHRQHFIRYTKIANIEFLLIATQNITFHTPLTPQVDQWCITKSLSSFISELE